MILHCELCKKAKAVLHCYKIIRIHDPPKSNRVKEVQGMELCRECYHKVMFDRSYDKVVFQQESTKRGKNKKGV